MAITRRASEDNRLRVFLSSHFDAQTYVINIIKEGRSEEAYNEIVSCLKEVYLSFTFSFFFFSFSFSYFF